MRKPRAIKQKQARRRYLSWAQALSIGALFGVCAVLGLLMHAGGVDATTLGQLHWIIYPCVLLIFGLRYCPLPPKRDHDDEEGRDA